MGRDKSKNISFLICAIRVRLPFPGLLPLADWLQALHSNRRPAADPGLGVFLQLHALIWNS